MHFDRLKRRDFVMFLGSAAAWPFAARAQQPTIEFLDFIRAISDGLNASSHGSFGHIL
jgi:hypothetical protein